MALLRLSTLRLWWNFNARYVENIRGNTFGRIARETDNGRREKACSI